MQLLYYKSVIPRFAEEREGTRGELSTFKVSQTSQKYADFMNL